MTNKCLKSWEELKNTTHSVSFVDILNACLNAKKIPHKELENFYDVERKLVESNEKIKVIEKERNNLQQRCESLYQDLLQEQELRRLVEEKADIVDSNFEKLKEENSYLHEYAEKIAELSKCQNMGKKLPELKERQQRRKIKGTKI